MMGFDISNGKTLNKHPNFRVLPFFRTEANEKRRFFIETRQNVISAHSPAQV